MSLKITHLEIEGLAIIEPQVFLDTRGWLIEGWKRSEFEQAQLPSDFPQDIHASSKEGVVRGLHFQIAPMAQGKLVRCIAGAIYDVAVDVRHGSKTFGKHLGVELSATNRKMFWVPEGFAHGYCALKDGTEVLYKVTREYSKAHEKSVRWNDPALGIRWPFAQPMVSDKDAAAPLLSSLQGVM